VEKVNRSYNADSLITFEFQDVKMAAELLTVSADTVYDLFKSGELPGRKVGRKWLSPVPYVGR
jgi:excisionase family DNA binding protein